MMAPGADKAPPSTRNERDDGISSARWLLKPLVLLPFPCGISFTITFVQTSLNWARVEEKPDSRGMHGIN